MNQPPKRQFRLTSFILPGVHHIFSGYLFKGIVFLSLALAVCSAAYCLNRFFFLDYLWKLKAMTVPHTLIDDFYRDKQATIYNFVRIYLMLGFGAFLDLAFLSPEPAPLPQSISGLK